MLANSGRTRYAWCATDTNLGVHGVGVARAGGPCVGTHGAGHRETRGDALVALSVGDGIDGIPVRGETPLLRET